MSDTLKQLAEMIENDGFFVWRGCMLYKSESDEHGYAVGKMPNHKQFEPERYFGNDLAGAILYLYEMERE
jgi:hypothetical protein